MVSDEEAFGEFPAQANYTDPVIALEERIENYMELRRGEPSSIGSFHQ